MNDPDDHTNYNCKMLKQIGLYLVFKVAKQYDKLYKVKS